MIYDPVDVRISVSNKSQVWKGGSEAPGPSPRIRHWIRDTSLTGVNTSSSVGSMTDPTLATRVKTSLKKWILSIFIAIIPTCLLYSPEVEVVWWLAPRQIIYIKSVMHLQSFPGFVFYQPYLPEQGWDYPYPLSLILFPVFCVNKIWPYFHFGVVPDTKFGALRKIRLKNLPRMTKMDKMSVSDILSLTLA